MKSNVIGLAIAGLLLMCVSASAQDWTRYSDRWAPYPSRFTYAQYNIGGESVYATYHRVGRFSYGYYSDGSMSTTTKVGSRSYTDVYIRDSRKVGGRW